MNNKIKLLMVAFVAVISIVSCKKEINWNALGENTSPKGGTVVSGETEVNSTYYITYKVNGVSVVAKDISAVRDISTSPRTLTFTGNATGGTVPKIRFFAQESELGFVKGINMRSYNGSYQSYNMQYTNNSSVLFSTENDSEGIWLFIADISYKNDGFVKGSFSGTVKTAKGEVVEITEGKFNVKFNN